MTRKLFVVLAITVTASRGAAIARPAPRQGSPTPRSTRMTTEGTASRAWWSARARAVTTTARSPCSSRRARRNVRRDKKIGSDRATPNGDGSRCRIDFEGSGKYYTYVKQTKSCGRADSRVVTVSPGN